MTPYFLNDEVWNKFMPIVESWLETPYRHLTMVKGRGADCTLFIGACWQEAGILTEVTYDYYPRDWHYHTTDELVLDGLYRHFSEHAAPGFKVERLPKRTKFLRGDMLSFATTAVKVSNHASIYLANGYMVHSINRRGVSYFPFGGYWERKVTAVFRILGK